MNKSPEIDEINSAFFDLTQAIDNFVHIIRKLQNDVDKIKAVLKID
jgi:hypothetical protein